MRTWILALALFAAACGKKSDSDKTSSDEPVASCMVESMHGCVEYHGGNLAAGSDNLAKLCTVVDKKAVFSMTACPTANRIGTCKRNEGTDVYYEGNPLGAAAELEKMCIQKEGTWSK